MVCARRPVAALQRRVVRQTSLLQLVGTRACKKFNGTPWLPIRCAWLMLASMRCSPVTEPRTQSYKPEATNLQTSR